MPQHRVLRHPLHTHPCPTITRRGNLGGSRRNPHSRAVFLPHDRTVREHVEETRKHEDASSPTTTPALASFHLRATPLTRWQRSPDLTQVASSTHSQLTA